MLTHIHIQDFAIIEQLELDLDNGMTAITGETGAGKSIMLDAIGLVLGDRAEASMVRHGARRADISVGLDKIDDAIRNWLEEHDLDAGDGCVLRRVITAEGRSRAYINGSPTTVTSLRALGEKLVNIHGQHAHQSLLKPADQRALLDSHGQLGPLCEQVASAHKEWLALKQQVTQLQDQQQSHLARLDLLTFQLNELQELGLKSGEFEVLEETLNRLSHAEQLKQYALGGYQNLYESEEIAVHTLLNRVLHNIQQASEIDPTFAEASGLLESAMIQVEEAAQLLRQQADSIDADPATLADVEARYNRAQALARKHRILPEELPELAQAMTREIEEITDPTLSPEALDQALTEAAASYDQLTLKLRKARQSVARTLETSITAAMQELGMEGGRFAVELEPLPNDERRSHGRDQIRFLVSTNPGQPLKPLASVASGGELSRISLAITLVATGNMQLPTLIFDEVDSGIGGAVAEAVGRQLRQLGERCQVFCVTHLPQVAACAHHHLQVEKHKGKNSTHTRLRPLDEEQRIEEIARMLGGAKITQQSRNHAREMLQTGQR